MTPDALDYCETCELGIEASKTRVCEHCGMTLCESCWSEHECENMKGGES